SFRGAVARLLRLPQGAPCLKQELISLRAGAPQRALRLVADPIGLVLRSRCGLRGVGRRDARLLQRGGELGPLPLRLEQGALQRAVKLTQMRVGAAEHFLVESEAFGDRERVGRTGQPEPQAEGRPQSVRVEL